MAITIEKKLSDAGYALLGDTREIGSLIQDILKTSNIRYLKAIPFLLYKYDLDIDSIRKKLKNKELELFNSILDISELIFDEFNIKRKIPRQVRGDSKIEGTYAKKVAQDYKEFKEEFELQLRNENRPNLLIDTQKIDEERNLQFALSQIFTKKEKQIIKRLQEEKPISRTEYEYYSRKTKKKLKSIIYLSDFAKGIHSKTPAYDKELFELKSHLEDLFSKELDKGVSMEEFRLSDEEIIVSLKDEYKESLDIIWKLSKIKDKNILKSLHKYKEHDFR